MKKLNQKNIKGFTLIELLVVIGIITLLSSVILSSLTQAKAQANNTKQIADYRVVLNALIQFKQENGYYPSNGGLNTYTCIGNYSEGGCKVAGSVISNNTTMNDSLKKYLSSYSFIDTTIKIVTGIPPSTSTYKGFVLSCISGTPQCQTGKLLFPALKNRNSCPQIMSDINTGEFYATVLLDYTWCQVDLN